MRVTWSGFFTGLGILLTYLFATGAPHGDTSLFESAFEPFQRLSSKSVTCVLLAFAAFVVALFFSACSRHGAVSHGRTYSKSLLETAFTLNAALIAGVLLVFVAYGLGWIPHNALNAETLGALTMMALLALTFGFVVAGWLFIGFREKSHGLYFSVLAIHVVEVSVFGSVFLTGIKS